MKTDDPQNRAARTTACPTPVLPPRGEGVGEKAKTNKPQKTGIVGGKKRGGQPGNRNAAGPVTALSRARDLNRRIRAALREAKKMTGNVGSRSARSSFHGRINKETDTCA